MLTVGQANQYEEVRQRINRLLHEAAQRGHVEIVSSGVSAPNGVDGASETRSEDSGNGLPVVCEYFSPREVAAMLKLSMDMVYTMLREGELPAIRLGAGKRQVWRIPQIEFRAYLAAIRTGPELKTEKPEPRPDVVEFKPDI